MKRRNKALILAAGPLLCALCHCSLTSVAGGDVTETGNARIAGVIVDTRGVPVSRVYVQAVPQGFNPVSDSLASADSYCITGPDGRYVLRKLDSGTYNVQSMHLDNGYRGLVVGCVLGGRDSLWAGADTIRQPGSVRITLPAGVDSTSGFVYVPGTTIYIDISLAQNGLILGNVPAGVIPEISYVPNPQALSPTPVVKAIRVVAGDTVASVFALWRYSAKLHLNTSGTGAGVSGTVVRFPVLVRLTEANFAFGQAAPAGADLRFAASNGSPLPYETEAWDATVKQAALWVTVDTVFGGNASQYITLFWGNPSAAAPGAARAVFDTAAGHAAVYHMAAACGDATQNRRNGVYYGTLPSSGIIASGRQFDGNDSIKIPGLMGTPRSLTLSAWVWIDTASQSGGEVVSIGNAALLRVNEANSGPLGTNGAFHIDTLLDSSAGEFRWVGDSSLLSQRAWHHCAFSIDGSGFVQALYIDGRLVKTSAYSLPVNYAGVGQNTFIGSHGNREPYFMFYGGIDEVRIDKVVRSSDWIRLCFMNQKPVDALVKFQ